MVKLSIIILASIVCVFNTAMVNAQLVVNEVVSTNASGLADEDGDYPDWIEIYNTTSSPVDLFNYQLSDNGGSDLWTFPTVVLAPKSFLVVFASDKNRKNTNELHTDFKIKSEGESVSLYTANGVLMSIAPAMSLQAGQSLGCITDGDPTYVIFDTPTPSQPNTESAYLAISKVSGFYADSLVLNLVNGTPCDTIRYTLDGKKPTAQSLQYEDKIVISESTAGLGGLSSVPTTPLTGPSILNFFIWKAPQKVSKINTLSYAAVCDDTLASLVYRHTYIDQNIADLHSFPIVSLVLDSGSLFDRDTGIYVPGASLDAIGWNGGFPRGNYTNRGRGWERDVHASYFSTDDKLEWATRAGIRLRGGGSTSFAQKSFTLYFRSEYGTSAIDYPFFEETNLDEYKRLAFRNSGNDFVQTHFRDAMLQSLLSDFDIEKQQSSPCVVYINGENWGIHNIREKQDDHFLHELTGIDREKFNIIEGCITIDEGDNASFIALLDYVKANDLSTDVAYDYVGTQIDISNVIDYFIAQIYFANYDWPYSNMKLWKPEVPGGKWRYILYDLDFSTNSDNLSGYWINSMEHVMDTVSWPRSECSSRVFRKLLTNEEFQERFLQRFSFHLSNSFQTKRVVDRINEFEQRYRPEMDEHIARWNYPENIAAWEQQVETIRAFAINRPCQMQNDLINFFGLERLDFQCLDGSNSNYTENDIILSPNPVVSNVLWVTNLAHKLGVGSYNVFDSHGRIVESGELTDYSLQVDISALANGVYSIQVARGDRLDAAKFVIMR